MNGHWPLYVAYENEDPDGFSRVYVTGSLDGGVTWSAPIRVNDGPNDVEALQPRVEVAPNGTVAVVFYDRRLACPSESDTASGVQFDPLAPAGKRNFCVNTAIQFYRPDLTPVGDNIRLSQFTWDPQLNAPKRSCVCASSTFLGDYFGLDFGGGYAYTTSISTYDYGANPSNYQQQIVARVPLPYNSSADPAERGLTLDVLGRSADPATRALAPRMRQAARRDRHARAPRFEACGDECVVPGAEEAAHRRRGGVASARPAPFLERRRAAVLVCPGAQACDDGRDRPAHCSRLGATNRVGRAAPACLAWAAWA